MVLVVQQMGDKDGCNEEDNWGRHSYFAALPLSSTTLINLVPAESSWTPITSTMMVMTMSPLAARRSAGTIIFSYPVHLTLVCQWDHLIPEILHHRNEHFEITEDFPDLPYGESTAYAPRKADDGQGQVLKLSSTIHHCWSSEKKEERQRVQRRFSNLS